MNEPNTSNPYQSPLHGRRLRRKHPLVQAKRIMLFSTIVAIIITIALSILRWDLM